MKSGSGSTQNENCVDTGICGSTTNGDSNTQNLNCAGEDCSAFIFGNMNSQNTNCRNTFCDSRSFDSTNLGPLDSNTQSTACQASGACINSGINTNVVSNLAPSCVSGNPDTTTYCQGDRTFTFPN